MKSRVAWCGQLDADHSISNPSNGAALLSFCGESNKSREKTSYPTVEKEAVALSTERGMKCETRF